jgi:hypothetical protein
VELHWRNASQQVFKIIPMTNDGKYQFRAEIPNPGENSRIEYFIKMVNSYYEWTNPQGAPDNFYSYHVGLDQIAPIFSHVPLKSSFIEKKPRQILVSAKDNIALNTNTVYVHYASKSVSDSIKLKAGENPEQFSGYLPAIFAYGDTVSYYFSGYDKAASPNRGQSMVFSFIVGFEDFESGLNNWIVSPDGWGLVKGTPYSGNYTINDSPNQVSYSNNRDVSITTSLGFDLSNSDHAALKFWTRVFLEINSDFGYVEISNDGGKTWKQLGDAINDFNETWKQQTLSLSDYCGSGNTDVRLRFRMVSVSHQGPPVPGWFIDDVQIIEGLEVTRVAEQNNAIIPEKFALYQNYPNPFNPNTTIQFDLSQSGKVSVKIFNVRGELIRALIQSQVNAGSHVVNWDGRDENGQNLASGLYFYQLTVNSFSATKKLLLIK